MRTSLVIAGWNFSLALSLLGTAAQGQDGTDAVLGSPNGWQRYDWLSPSGSSTSTTATNSSTGGKLTGTAGQNLGDPFVTVTEGALWQERYGAAYTQSLTGETKLVYETDALTLNENSQPNAAPTDGTPDDLSHQQKAGIQLQPLDEVTLGGNVHDAADDAGSPSSSMETRGAEVTAQAHLPMNSTLTLDGDSDTTSTGAWAGSSTTSQSYDAQFQVPLQKIPVTAQLKGGYQQAGGNGSNLSLDQALTWKPADTTTVQMGLRQQQYQSFPGIANELNEAVFADWSQTLVPEITWHSYAEVLTSRAPDVAPAAPATTGTNGTPQSADPTNTMSLPNSLTDQTVTFTTGPSFKLDKDVSASVEYSNRIDTGASGANAEQDQRVSVSLKGTF